jgi:putative ABC transport system substrate-binding protein
MANGFANLTISAFYAIFVVSCPERVMRRREFITLVGGAAAAWPLAARAQQPNSVPTIGYLAAISEVADRSRRAAFVKRLGELGWSEGGSVRIEYRWAGGVLSNAAANAAEFARLKVDVIVPSGDTYVLAAKQATATIPIVFASAGDPVGNGLVKSLARPGGNITGLSIELTESVGKRIGFLREVVPSLHRLAILFNVADPLVNTEKDAALTDAGQAGFDLVRSEIRPDQDLAPAIEALKGRVDALYVCLDPLTFTKAGRINALALSARLPVMHSIREQAEADGLISYGPDFPNMSRRAAELVDKILRGTSPAEIPVEQPTKFDFVINLKTAKALGITVPERLLIIADEVIE